MIKYWDLSSSDDDVTDDNSPWKLKEAKVREWEKCLNRHFKRKLERLVKQQAKKTSITSNRSCRKLQNAL